LRVIYVLIRPTTSTVVSFERVVRIHWSGEIRSYFYTSKIPTVYIFWSLKTTMVTTELDDKLI
jgi:hypothetical protein